VAHSCPLISLKLVTVASDAQTSNKRPRDELDDRDAAASPRSGYDRKRQYHSRSRVGRVPVASRMSFDAERTGDAFTEDLRSRGPNPRLPVTPHTGRESLNMADVSAEDLTPQLFNNSVCSDESAITSTYDALLNSIVTHL